MEMEAQSAPTASSKAPAGLLPIPDYSANIWTREYLTGDWWSARTYLANKGVQIGVELNQYVQGVTNGGRDRTAAYGGTADYTVNLDLMRMGILPGALIKFRAESRFGSSVNGQAGPILPVNTDALFPLTVHARRGYRHHRHRSQLYPVPFALSGRFLRETRHARWRSKRVRFRPRNQPIHERELHFQSGVGFAASLQHAGRRGDFDAYSPRPERRNHLVSTVMNTQDSSTTSGFDDFDEGTTWNSEVDFQYRLGPLPGGLNVGGLYSFNQNFAALNTRFVFQPGEGLVCA